MAGNILAAILAAIAGVCVFVMQTIILLAFEGEIEEVGLHPVATIVALLMIFFLWRMVKTSNDNITGLYWGNAEMKAALEMVVASLDVGAEHQKLHKLAKTAVKHSRASADADMRRADEIERKDPRRETDRAVKEAEAFRSQRAFWNLRDALAKYGLLLPKWEKVVNFADSVPGPTGWDSDAPAPTAEAAPARR